MTLRVSPCLIAFFFPFIATAFQPGTPPGSATNSFPVNNATNLSRSLTLRWTNSGSNVVNDLYLNEQPGSWWGYGTNLVESVTLRVLKPATTYYWRLNSHNAYGSAQSTEWSFTTKDANLQGDFDHQGIPDYVFQEESTGRTQLHTLEGRRPILLEYAQGWSVVGMADFNGDGDQDLVWQNVNTRQVAVWYMKNQFCGNWLCSTDGWLVQSGPIGWTVVSTADFNRDGKPDLVWQNDETRQVAVWYMGGSHGDTFLSDAMIAANGPKGWRVAGAADFNDDEKPDLVWQNDQTRQVTVWYMSGSQGNTYAGDAWLAPDKATPWRVVGVGDFNGDDKTDLLWQNDNTRQITVWYMSGPNGNLLLKDDWVFYSQPLGWRAIGPR